MPDPSTRALLRGDLREALRLATPADQIAIVAATKSATLAQALLDAPNTPAVIAFAAAIAGDRVRALSLLTPDAFHSDDAQLACEASVVIGDANLVSQALNTVDHVLPREDLRPIAALRGELYLLAGRVEEAVRSVEEGLTVARSADAVPYVADAATVLARALDARGEPGDRERAVVLSAEAHELWHRCSLAL